MLLHNPNIRERVTMSKDTQAIPQYPQGQGNHNYLSIIRLQKLLIRFFPQIKRNNNPRRTRSSRCQPIERATHEFCRFIKGDTRREILNPSPSVCAQSINLDLCFVNPITFVAKNSNHLIVIGEMIIAEAIYCITTLLLWIFQRGQFFEFSNGRVPQKSEALIKGETEDTVARANDEIKTVSIVQRVLVPRGASGDTAENGNEWVSHENKLAWGIGEA